MELVSGKFSGYFKACILLHSRNVLVILDLLNGARSWIKIYSFSGNTTHSHKSIFTVINRMRNIMLSVFRLL